MDPARRGHGWVALQRPGRPDAARPDGRADLRADAATNRQHTDRLDGPADRGANPLPIAVLINRSPHTDRHGDAETKPQATIILVRRGTVERAGREPAAPAARHPAHGLDCSPAPPIDRILARRPGPGPAADSVLAGFQPLRFPRT